MGNPSTIILDPIIDLSNIDNLHKLCQAALDDNSTEIHMDASQVERLKTPVFQFLIIFKTAAQVRGKKLFIDNPSEALRGLQDLLGLKEDL
jgi:ABC-type transporter Mla MlaB component